MDFDIACISHPRPFNAAAVTEVGPLWPLS